MMFQSFNSQSERIKKIGSDCLEFQFCRKKMGTPVKMIVSVSNVKPRDNASLYVSGENLDSGLFGKNYGDFFTDGVYANGESGPLDWCGINYYTPEQVKFISEKLKARNSADDRILLGWLQKAEKYNGFYVLGV